MLHLALRGLVRDVRRLPHGRRVTLEAGANFVAYAALDLIADLLRGRPHVRGLLYWAVGEGDPSWDVDAPITDRYRTRLFRERRRKRLDPDRDLAYDPATQTVAVRQTFTAAEFAGPYREFGVFGGDASARPDSGRLVSYRVHDVVTLAPGETLERELSIEIGAEIAQAGARDLIGRLLIDDGTAGLSYVALGEGLESWDQDGLPEPDPNRRTLENETFRAPLNPAWDVRYDADSHALTAEREFPFDLPRGVIREAGLFGGDADTRRGSGLLAAYRAHEAVDKRVARSLTERFEILIGRNVQVAVPDLSGHTLDDALDELRAVDLLRGTITEQETEQPGTILQQSPAAGVEVLEGSRVDLTLGIAVRVQVPNVVGLSREDAVAALEAVGLGVDDDASREVEDKTEPGTVLKQDPKPGTRVGVESLVAFTLSAGIRVETPDIVGMPREKAWVALTHAGLRLADEPDATQESDLHAGAIVAQFPPAGELLLQGSIVGYVAAALPAVETPNLIGLTPDEAAAALREAAAQTLEDFGLPTEPPGLSLGELRETTNTDVERGRVAVQNPASGSRTPLFTAVEVAIAALGLVEVPKLLGLSPQQAAAALVEAGLALGEQQSRASSTQSDVVLGQEPRPGVQVRSGTSVDLVVAVAATVEVPRIAGQMLDAAEETLKGRGLRVQSVQTQPSDRPENTVLAQSPTAGTSVPLGSGVRLTLAGRAEPLVFEVAANNLESRVECVTSLRGTIEINVSGGTPTPAGRPVPTFDLIVKTNREITCRSTGEHLDLALVIDQPQRLDTRAISEPDLRVSGNGQGLSYRGGAAPNVFLARREAINVARFDAVPIDPPPAGSRRRLTLLNLRTGRAVDGSQDRPLVSMGLTGTAPARLEPSEVALGVDTRAFAFERILRAPGGPFGDARLRLAGGNNLGLLQTTRAGEPDFFLSFVPQARSVFRVRARRMDDPFRPDPEQESGFTGDGLPITAGNRLVNVGLADSGTRMLAIFSGLPNGVRLFVTTRDFLESNQPPTEDNASAFFVATRIDGSGGQTPTQTPPGSGHRAGRYPLQELGITNGRAFAAWEYVSPRPFQGERMLFGVAVAFRPGGAQVGRGIVERFAAPVNRATVEGGPIPRFEGDGSGSQIAFQVLA